MCCTDGLPPRLGDLAGGGCGVRLASAGVRDGEPWPGARATGESRTAYGGTWLLSVVRDRQARVAWWPVC